MEKRFWNTKIQDLTQPMPLVRLSSLMEMMLSKMAIFRYNQTVIRWILSRLRLWSINFMDIISDYLTIDK